MCGALYAPQWRPGQRLNRKHISYFFRAQKSYFDTKFLASSLDARPKCISYVHGGLCV